MKLDLHISLLGQILKLTNLTNMSEYKTILLRDWKKCYENIRAQHDRNKYGGFLRDTRSEWNISWKLRKCRNLWLCTLVNRGQAVSLLLFFPQEWLLGLSYNRNFRNVELSLLYGNARKVIYVKKYIELEKLWNGKLRVKDLSRGK